MPQPKRSWICAIGLVAMGFVLEFNGAFSNSCSGQSAELQSGKSQKTLARKPPLKDSGGWNQFGRDGTRNPVSFEKNAPLDWQVASPDVKTNRNVLWSARLGSNSMGDPVVAGGLVWVGTNEYVRVERRTDASVLLCVNARNGKPVYGYVSPRLPGRYRDWPRSSLGCSPLVEGNRVWFTTNRCEVVCLDISALKKGGGKPKQLWKVDMMKEFGVIPRGPDMGAVHIASVAGYGKFLYAVTGNGTDNFVRRVAAPNAPSLLCLEKATGKVVWKDASPGANILAGQWSSPAVYEINGQVQIVVAQGDGWVRAFAPQGDGKGSSRLIWKFDINPKTARYDPDGYRGDRHYIVGTPVFHDGRLYVGSGVHPFSSREGGRLVCIDPTKKADISEKLAVDAKGKKIPHRRLQAVEPSKGEKAIPNPNSGLIWAFNQNNQGFEKGFHGTVSRVAVHAGLVIVPNANGLVQCLDAKTGKRHWSHDLLVGGISASPLIIDGKVYVADEDGVVTIFALAKKKRKIAQVEMPDSIFCSPVFANGVLYVATRSRLYAISGAGKAAVGAKGKPQKPGARIPKAAFAPTPNDVVQKMLELAAVKKTDTVCDLGSGDGRIVIAAAKTYGCRAFGYELNNDLVLASRKRAKLDDVASLTTFERKDIFTVDLSRVDVVTLYLLPRQNAALIPKLNKMKRGSRVVAHEYAIPGVKAARKVSVQSRDSKETHTLYLYTTPLSVAKKSPKK